MTFWALGAFDKVKNMTERLNIKDVSKKVISYVAEQSKARQQQDDSPSLYRGSLKQENISPIQHKKVLSSKQRMEVQLNQYKKLVKMQEQILQSHYRKERQLLLEKQALLQKENNSLIEQQQTIRKEASKGILIEQIQSGKSQNLITQSQQKKQYQRTF